MTKNSFGSASPTYPSMHGKEGRPSGKGRFLCGDMEGVGLVPDLRYNDPTCLHTISIRDVFSGESWVFFDPYEMRDPNNRLILEQEGEQDGYLVDALYMLMESEAIAFQNMVGYDGIGLEIVYPSLWRFNYVEARGKGREHSDYFPMKLMDTMLISQILNPDRSPPPQAFALGMGNVGPHSIAAHGLRIGRHKPENEDWSILTDHMVHRCDEDTYIGNDFFFWLMNNEWADHLRRGRNKQTGLGIVEALRMETQIAIGISRQAMRGFRLATKKAWDEWVQIGEEMQDIVQLIDPYIPPRLVTVPMKRDSINSTICSFSKAYPNADASWLSKHLNAYLLRGDVRIGSRVTMWSLSTLKGDYKKDLQKVYPEMVGNINDTKDPLVSGPFTPIVFEEIGLGNLDFIKKEVLYPRGWLGVNFSEADEKYMNDKKANPEGLPPYPWSGKIDEDSLTAWRLRDSEMPEWLEHIVDWYVLRSRRSQILNVKDMEYFEKNRAFPKQKDGRHYCKGLLAKARSHEHGMEAWEYFLNMGEFPLDEEEDWRVPAEAFSIGTNTFRMRHKFVVNIPSRGLHPLRHLFIASKGKMILGCDGSGLELRMLAHFMNDPEYTEIVLNGDIHTHNQLKAGLPQRDMAKTFIYAFLYGSGIPNLAAVCGLSEKVMRDKVEQFKRELPALSLLIKRCEEAGARYGYLLAVDGRWGRIRKVGGGLLMHTVLNVLLQMTGSLSMKYSKCIAEDALIEENIGLDENGFPCWLADVHDEWQMEIPEDEVEEVIYEIKEDAWKAEEKAIHLDDEGRMWSAPVKLSGKGTGTLKVMRRYHRAGHILADSMRKAGEFLNMRIPLAGEYKIGYSWHDTH